MKKIIRLIMIFIIIVGIFSGYAKAETGLSIKNVDKISAGGFFTVGLINNGTVWVWGRYAREWCGIRNASIPSQIVGLERAVEISAGWWHLAVLKEDGTVWTIGNNNFGELGDGTNNYSNIPVQVRGLDKIIAISAGDHHTAALKGDGTVWIWGRNEQGQLGDGTNNDSNVPIQVKGLDKVTSVSAGHHHTVALKEDGTVWIWGKHNNNRPEQVMYLEDVMLISAGLDHSVALQKDGTVWQWGPWYNSGEPFEIIDLEDIVYLSSGYKHAIAVAEDGTVWQWGRNRNYDSNKVNYDGSLNDHIPVKIKELDNVISVATGRYHEYHVVALKEDGTIWGWGENNDGQLGYTIGKNINIPVQTVFNLGDSMVSENILKDYIYDEGDPGASIILPYENISKITNKETAAQVVLDAAKKLTKEQKQSPTGIDLITLFSEEALAQSASTIIKGNNIEINSKTIIPLQTIVTESKMEINKTLTSQGITTVREISTAIKLKTESNNEIKITLDKSILTTKADKITIESPNISVKIDTVEIKEDLKDSPLIITINEDEALAIENSYQLASTGEIQLSAQVKRTYTVNFNRAVKENITVSLPKIEGDVKYQAVIKSDGTVVGGKYNPAKNTIDVKIKESGKYTVKENKKDFTDIKNKSKEMQEAIKVLASKGIIDGNTATTFNPDGPISRAEITALIIKTLSKVDKTAEVKFKDITTKDWYYNIAGSSMKYGIINGYDDNTFRGKQQIKKNQIIAVAARTLKTEMKYKDPKDTMIYLNSYKDNTKIASWAKADISLATRENLVLKRVDGNFLGDDYMTRGDAAIVIKRLFDKIW